MCDFFSYGYDSSTPGTSSNARDASPKDNEMGFDLSAIEEAEESGSSDQDDGRNTDDAMTGSDESDDDDDGVPLVQYREMLLQNLTRVWITNFWCHNRNNE